jgi:hypothetical protein
VAARGELRHDRRADEACAADDEDAHGHVPGLMEGVAR